MSDAPIATPSDPVPPAPIIKPGWKTTEFALTLVAWVAAFIAQSGAFPATSPEVKGAAWVVAGLATFGYTSRRTSLKATAMRLPIYLLGLAMLSQLHACTPIRQCMADPKPTASCLIGQDAVECSEALLPAAGAALLPLLNAGETIDAAGAQLGIDGLKDLVCVATEAIAQAQAGKFLAPPWSSPTSAPARLAPAVLAAELDEWKAAKGIGTKTHYITPAGSR